MLVDFGMRRCAIVACGLGLTVGAAAAGHRIAANGVQVVVPAGWHRVAAAGEAHIVDPKTVLVVGTAGVHARLVPCQIAAYRIPPRGAAVVVVRWRTETSGGGSNLPHARTVLRRLRLNHGGFECWPGHLGGAVDLALAGHAYQVNVMIGDRATRRTVAQALAVVSSFDLRR